MSPVRADGIVTQLSSRVGGEARRAVLAVALGVGLGLLARVFETKEARAWRERSKT